MQLGNLITQQLCLDLILQIRARRRILPEKKQVKAHRAKASTIKLETLTQAQLLQLAEMLKE